MPTRRAVIAGFSTTALILGAAVALPALATSRPVQTTFSRPMILAGGGAEPSIRVPTDHKVTAYISAPTGLGSNFWVVTTKHNRDGSITYQQSPVQQPDLGTGGGDSDISVGNKPSETTGCDPIAYVGLHNIDLLDNFTVATSSNCGKTFSLANPYATQNTLTDRQWMTFDGSKTNFLIYHKVDTGQIVVSESPDGGQHYVSLGASGANGIISPQLLAQSGTNQQIGNIVTNYAEPIAGVTNPLTGEQVHAMYAIFGIATNTENGLAANAPGSTYNGIDTIYVARSVDGGLTWTDNLVFAAPFAAHRELNMLFPVISADSAGHLYAAWADTFKVQYAESTDHGAHWSQPYQVNADNRGSLPNGADRPDPGKADVFPWIAAGAKGMLDVVWYHGQGGSPTSNLAYRDPGDSKTQWTVAFAQLKNADTTTKAGVPSPTVLAYSQAITPVVHIGDICQNGTFCALVPVSGAPYSTGDRSLLDFFEVAVDNEGRANVAIADNAAAPGQLFSAFTQQISGYSLTTGKPLTPFKVEYPTSVCAPDASFKGDDNADQVLVSTPAPSQPALAIKRGYVTWNAAAKTVTFHAVMQNLSQYPPAGATGAAYDYAFGINGKAYDMFGNHDLTGDSADIEQPIRTQVSKDVKFAYNTKTNEVTFTLPADALAKISSPTVRGPVIGPGIKITGLSITSRRSEGAVLVPNADSANGLCPFVVPTHGSISSFTVPPAGGNGDPWLLPAPPAVGASLSAYLRSLLPDSVLALLLGLLAATVTNRRQRFGLVAA
ncbi:MAG TPA: hypothetical protein VNG13_01500 [Mycobacteriales bacterium]|nr:hypothetical protein [Mycobacteriales bacterium]